MNKFAAQGKRNMEECVNSGVAEEHDKKYLGIPQVTDAEKEDRANFIERDASAIE